MQLEFEMSPGRVSIPIIGEISQTVLVTWIVMAVLVVFGLLFKFVLVKRFKEVPKGFQACVELYTEFVMNFTKSKLGKYSRGLEAYVFILPIFLAFSGLIELFGLRPPTSDLSLTATLALISFVLINYYGIKAKGVWGRMKSFGAIAPIKVITEIAIPVSLACRMFGNMLGGMIVMEIIYAACALIIPGVFSLYFNLFHVLIQTYIFLNLSLSFVNEAIE